MGWSRHHNTGLIYHSPQRALDGYTLVSTRGGTWTNLIDMKGNICHRWEDLDGIMYARLLPNGNLLLRSGVADEAEGMGGSSKSLKELDWESNVVWEYKNTMLHHDFRRLSNGNTIALAWEILPESVAVNVIGGYVDENSATHMYGDKIIEVDPKGNLVKEVRLWENLDFDQDQICFLENRKEWTHANSLDFTNDGDFLVSFRQTSTIGIVDNETGVYKWKWGPGKVSHQHNPNMLSNGNILLFDKGAHRRGMNYSRLIEVNPSTDEIEWEYLGDPAMSFYSYNISNAERLPNGNTLVCEGAPGRLFEITSSGDIVWEYISPHFVYSPTSAGGSVFGYSNAVFRAHRYEATFSGFAGHDLNPNHYSNLNRIFA